MDGEKTFGRLNRKPPQFNPDFERGYSMAAHEDEALRDLWTRRQEILANIDSGGADSKDAGVLQALEKGIAREFERFQKDKQKGPR